MLGMGLGLGFGSSTRIKLPSEIPDLVAWYEGDTTTYPSAVTFPADPTTNGGFTGDSGWTKGTGWTLPGTVATHAAGSASDLSQTCLVIGNTYTITYTITSISAGSITCKAGSTAGTARSGVGTYSEKLLCADNTNLVFSATSDCDASIDDVVVAPQNVSQFTDLSGNSRHLLQATASKQPLWVPSGVGGVLRFDGSADFLKATFTLGQPVAIFVVAKITKQSGNKNIIDGNALYSMALLQASNLARADLYAFGAGTGNVTFTDQTWCVLDAEFNVGSSKVGLNGAVQNSGTVGAGSPGGITLGASASGTYLVIADVAALIAYNRSITASERKNVYLYCKKKASALGISI